MAKIRLGLIGCGHMMGIHAKAVNECTTEMEITAVCDIIRANAEAVAQVLHDPGKPSQNTREILWDKGTGKKYTSNEIDHFVDCVLHHKTPLTSGRTALESLRTIWKLYDAEKNNTVADLRSINPNSYL